MKKIKCQKCEAVVEHLKGRTAGCWCDSDAPTWVAIDANQQVLSFSHGKYEVIEE